MTIKQQGGIFGRNPTFNDLTAGSGSSIEGSGSNVEFSVNRTDASTEGSLLLKASNGTVSVESTGSNKDIVIRTGGSTERARFYGDSGDFSIKGNLVVDSGQGIDFSATSGTGTSELFDDYEEGTWTPTIYGSSTAGSPTYSQQIGRYTKIGNKVIAAARVDISAIGGMTGNVTFGGLPFTAAASVNQDVHVAILKAKNVTSEDTAFCVFPYNSQTNLLARSVNKNSDTALNITSIDSDAGFSFTITYQT